MAGYKDDLDAAHARIRALEQELAEKQGGATASAPSVDERRPRPRPRSGALLLLLLPFLALVGALYRQPMVWVVFAVTGLVAIALVALLSSLIVIARPSELVAISGSRGVRLATGGRILRQPLIEQASPPIDLSVMLLEETTRGVHCREGVAVELRWYALASVCGDPSRSQRAVERFLGRERQEIARVATETFEGCLRAAFAELHVEEAEQDPFKLAAKLRFMLEEELEKLGLEIHGCGILELPEARVISLIGLGAAIVLLIATTAILVKLLNRRAAPDEMLVVSGGAHPRFAIAHLQIPMIELVDRLELRAIEADLTLPEVEQRLGGKLAARVLVARDSEGLATAARLLLDLSFAERTRIVERVLQASAVGVLQQIGDLGRKDPDLESIAQQVSEEAEHELSRLGLKLDTVRFEPSR